MKTYTYHTPLIIERSLQHYTKQILVDDDITNLYLTLKFDPLEDTATNSLFLFKPFFF